MTGYEFGESPVMVFGQPEGLAEAIVEAIRRNGFPAAYGHPLFDLTPPGSRRRTDRGDSGPCDDSPDHAIDSVIIVLDAALTETLFDGRISCASRRLLRAGNDICGAAVTSVLAQGASRVLLTCDSRRLSFGRRARALRWLRVMAARIDYESAVNGVGGIATSYVVVNSEDDVRRIAAAVVTWRSGEALSDKQTPARSAVSCSATVTATQRRQRAGQSYAETAVTCSTRTGTPSRRDLSQASAM